MLLVPIVLLTKDLAPTATLVDPVVLAHKLWFPTAVLAVELLVVAVLAVKAA